MRVVVQDTALAMFRRQLAPCPGRFYQTIEKTYLSGFGNAFK